MNHQEESFKELEIKQPENIFKLTLIDEATGHIDQELEFKNTVGIAQTQKANHFYKAFANAGRYEGAANVQQVGSSDIAIALWSGDYGVSVDNAYAGVYQFNSFGDAMDTTQNFPFYVNQVIDGTHLNVGPSTHGMVNGDTITQYVSDALDTTRNVPFCVISVTDVHNLVVNSTIGFQIGDTVNQNGINATTITGVTDFTHVSVTNTAGWVSSLRTTTISSITDANNLVVVNTANWITTSGNGFYGSTSLNVRLTGYNYQNAITISGTGGGIYLPSYPGSGYQRNRAIQWVYEWGTTQANGTIAAVGFFPSSLMFSNGNGNTMLQIAQVPEMTNYAQYTYAGFQTVLSRAQLHFVTRHANLDNTTTQNTLAVINYDDFSLVQQKTINGTRNGIGSWSPSQKDIIFTPNGASGKEYWIVTTYNQNTPNITFQKVSDVPAGSSAAPSVGSPFTFTVMTVVDATHLTITPGYTGTFTAGDTITQTIQGNIYSTTITTVVDSTHLVVGSTLGWNVLIFGSAATNTTRSIPFFIVDTQGNSTTWYVNSSIGMQIGDTITQGIHTTTISNINNATQIVVNAPAGFTDGKFNVTFTKPSNWTTVYPNAWTQDATNIYALVYDSPTGRAGVLTINPTTLSASIALGPVQLGTNIGDSQCWNICPITGKLMAVYGASYIMEFPNITTLTQPTFVGAWYNNEYLNTNSWKTFLMHQTTDRIVGAYAEYTDASSYYGAFFEFNRGNYLTYATLPVIITKSNTQSLRIQYTLNW